MPKKRSDYPRISKTKRDRIIELSKDNTLEEVAHIMGVKPKSLKRRVDEMKQFYNMNVVFKGQKADIINPNPNPTNQSNVLVVGDIHEPFSRDGYLEFCKDMYKKWNCTSVIFIGDLLDNHFSSFHDTDPDGHSAAMEFDLAKTRLDLWNEAFPIAKVCLGNHDLIPDRKAFSSGLSRRWIKSIGERLEYKGWEYGEKFVINDVMYTHGTGRKARQRGQKDLISVVQGHYHSESYIEYYVGIHSKLWVMQVGCGIDDNAYAMAYGKYFNKSHINCAVVLEDGNLPILEYMKL